MAKPPNKRYEELYEEIVKRGGRMDYLKRRIEGKTLRGAWVIWAENKSGLFPVSAEEEQNKVRAFEDLYEEVEELTVESVIRRMDDWLDRSGMKDPEIVEDLEHYGAPETDEKLEVAEILFDVMEVCKRFEVMEVCKRYENMIRRVRRLRPDAYETLLNWLEES